VTEDDDDEITAMFVWLAVIVNSSIAPLRNGVSVLAAVTLESPNLKNASGPDDTSLTLAEAPAALT
jgi:hypothetical protein